MTLTRIGDVRTTDEIQLRTEGEIHSYTVIKTYREFAGMKNIITQDGVERKFPVDFMVNLLWRSNK